MDELKYITKFRIIKKIATGGMGTVYLAEQLGAEGFKKIVAIKTIKLSLISDPEILEMFIGEAKLVADLVHENIVQVYNFEKVNGIYFIVMEYVQGPTLEQFIKRHYEFMKKEIPWNIGAFIISQVARGLAYAHKKRDRSGKRLKIVHRDISPSNIIITYQGIVKITDFGTAKALTLKVPNEKEILLGKYPYMAPEQISLLGTDNRSDIFSLGLVSYELLTGKQVYKSKDTLNLLEEMRKPIKNIIEINPNIPTKLAKIIMKTLKINPDERYQTADELQKDLENFLYTSNQRVSFEKLANYITLIFPESKKHN